MHTIYLSGPMTIVGPPDYNAAEFKKWAEIYRARGWRVLSPPELDHGDFSQPYAHYMKRDIRVLASEGVDRIYMLPNWQQSKGAKLEKHIGEVLGVEIWDVLTDAPLAESTAQEAHRLVHGDRGAAYGHPLDDMGRTAGMLNALLHDKLHLALNARDVWQIMACVKLSRERNSPKRDNRVDLGGYAETGEMIETEAIKRGISLDRKEYLHPSPSEPITESRTELFKNTARTGRISSREFLGVQNSTEGGDSAQSLYARPGRYISVNSPETGGVVPAVEKSDVCDVTVQPQFSGTDASGTFFCSECGPLPSGATGSEVAPQSELQAKDAGDGLVSRVWKRATGRN